MKYIITESRLNNLIFKYLNDIDWEIVSWNDPQLGDMTRLFFKNESHFPEDVIFEALEDDVPIGHESEGPTERVLSINTSFYNTLINLFGLHHVEANQILIKWYESYTNETIDDMSLGFTD